MFAHEQTRMEFLNASLTPIGKRRQKVVLVGLQPFMSPEFFEHVKTRYLNERAEILAIHAQAVLYAKQDGVELRPEVKAEYPFIFGG